MATSTGATEGDRHEATFVLAIDRGRSKLFANINGELVATSEESGKVPEETTKDLSASHQLLRTNGN